MVAPPAFAAAPDTSIQSGPANPSATGDATFAFTGIDGGTGVASFECSLDDTSWSACTSPKTYTGLPDSSHVFQVRALDGLGTPDPTPAAFIWTVNVSPPDTTVSSGPADPSSTGDATFAFSGADSPTLTAKWGTLGAGIGQFNYPYSVAVDASGDVYVVDQKNNRVEKFDAAGAYLTQWGTLGTGNGQFNAPTAVAIDPSGNVYVSDSGNNRVEVFDSVGTYLWQFGSAGGGNGQFNSPRGIAFGPAGNIYVADVYNRRVQKFDASGGFLTAWGTNGTGDGQFKYPFGVAVAGGGHVFVVDYYNSNVQEFDANGGFVSRWGVYGTANGQLRYPYAISTGAGGNLYVADTYNHRIQVFTTGGSFVSTWGGFGTYNGQFKYPYGVAFGPSGDAYVADLGNNRIERFSTTVSFECSLDGAAFAACSSPQAYAGIADGAHTFSVRAIDGDGAADPSPAAYTWNVSSGGGGGDTTPPSAAPTQAPAANGAGWNNTDVTVTWNWTDAGSGVDPANCTTATTTTGEGNPLSVTATCKDLAGNTGTATYSVKVDKTAPDTAITSGPSGATNATSAAFGFAGSDAGSGVTSHGCKLDAASWAPCTSPVSYTGLGQGSHTFSVRATDAAGNTDATPAARSWTVDTTPPAAAPTQSPTANGAGWNNTDVTVTWNWSDVGSGVDPANCTTSTATSGEGNPLTVTANCKDLAGNTGSASYSVKVDKTAPTVTTPVVTVSANRKTAMITFSASDPTLSGPSSGVASSECRLTTSGVPGAWTSCASGVTYTLTKNVQYLIEVRATDVAGNVGTPASRSWTQ